MMPLVADRELDARVAEAMGYVITSHDWPQGFTPDDGSHEAALSMEECDIYPWHCYRGPVFLQNEQPTPVPLFSTSLAAAMGEPWEWLKSHTDAFSLHVGWISGMRFYYLKWWNNWHSNETEAQPTEALAIAAAVLAAKETNESNQTSMPVVR